MSTRTIYFGPPGTGKTATLLQRLEEHLAIDRIAPERIAFLTFTRRARAEAVSRVERVLGITAKDLPHFRTIHSMAFKALRLSDGDVVGREQLTEFGALMGMEFGDVAYTEQAAEGLNASATGDQLLAIDNLSRLRGSTPRAVWREAGSTVEWPVVDQFCRSYREFKRERGLLDFTDVLQEYATRGEPLAVDVALIDEAQDLSTLQWHAALRAVNGAQVQYVAGDDDQCQPAGTLVATPDGPRPIEALRDGDRVLSYDRGWSGVAGMRRSVRVRVARRRYSGRLYTFDVNNCSTTTTAEHRCLVQFNATANARKVVYLMRHGTRWRIGQTQLRNVDGVVMLGAKLRMEGGDALWVLSVVRSVREAHYLEQWFSARYGIPQLRFKAGGGSLLTQAQIDSVHASTGTHRAACRLLRHKGLSVALPFWTAQRSKSKRGGARIFEMEACNVLPEVMSMLTLPTRKWRPVQRVLRARTRNAAVYSLAVERHHNYFADGILTHNCIYRWAGADVESFMSLAGEREVLKHSYRLPRAVHACASHILTRIKHRVPKEFAPRDADGLVVRHATHESLPLVPDDRWLWLVRNRYLLAPLRDYLQAQGVVYTMRGQSSVLESERNAIYTWERLRAGRACDVVAVREMYKKLRSGTQIKRGHKLLPECGDDDVLSLEELKARHGLLVDGAWFDVLVSIPISRRTYYRRLLRTHSTLRLAPTVQLETIHGSKGTEAPRVALFVEQSRRTWEEAQQHPDEEHRVWYVGATRAREELHVVEAAGRYAYRFPFGMG